MIDLTPADKLLLVQAYKTLRRTIYWAKNLAKSEWIHDHCRYPFRNYIKHGTEQDIKAAWLLRRLLNLQPHFGNHDL